MGSPGLYPGHRRGREARRPSLLPGKVRGDGLDRRQESVGGGVMWSSIRSIWQRLWQGRGLEELSQPSGMSFNFEGQMDRVRMWVGRPLHRWDAFQLYDPRGNYNTHLTPSQ